MLTVTIPMARPSGSAVIVATDLFPLKITILREHPERPVGACDHCLNVVGEQNLCNASLCWDCCGGNCSVCLVRRTRDEE